MHTRNQFFTGVIFALTMAVAPVAPAGSGETGVAKSASAPTVKADSPIDAGRYLVLIGGCNDCHTPNWPESGGAVPETDWLTGSPVGFRGPWGTSYPSNLRLLVSELDEEAWVDMMRHRQGLPPMPWINMNRLGETDSRALYRFIRSLGMSGQRMPGPVGPDIEPQTPYISFEPLHLERLQGAAP